MADEQITTIGKCYACKRTFSFIPASVTTVTIDPETGLPPGMTVLATFREPAPEATARSVEEPLCPNCLDRAKQFLELTSSPAPPFEKWHNNPDHD
ncbi:hypothetical protein AB0G15_36710 [Streptosporangium sp. NPDC023825]|uniref:hypothetical protein n=1 Tax=Streptosporangium sp. NPDC023825 TaxID=3154909 RepID=UPI00342C9254